jgi:hypothetical protein
MYGPESFSAFGQDSQKLSYTGAPSGGDFYGSAPQPRETSLSFKRIPRRRLNVVPIFACLFAPWVVFIVLYAALAFSMHYFQPSLTKLVVALSLIVVLGSVAYGAKFKLKKYLPQKEFDETPREPTWAVALALLMVIAWVAALILGEKLYNRYTSPYYDIQNFNTYADVRPDTMRGAQLMDAGIATFAENTTLDLTKAMGFKNGVTYCVAPIVYKPKSMEVYDFWAVGTNCCSSTSADFKCHGSSVGHGTGGVRWMDDGARAFFRLAVQEAEAQYSIKASHPVFFNWEADPVSVVEEWKRNLLRDYVIGVLAHFLFQAFAVICLTLFFSRLGSY